MRVGLVAVMIAVCCAAPAWAAGLKVPEGTEVRVRTETALSSGTATDGERFNIVLEDPIDLPGGKSIPAGYKGVGTVVHAQKRGHMGKAGQLNIQLDYIRIGDQRLRLRASQGSEGKGSLGSTVALTVLFGPLGLLARGANIVVPAGKQITAYVDNDLELTMPLAPAPAS